MGRGRGRTSLCANVQTLTQQPFNAPLKPWSLHSSCDGSGDRKPQSISWSTWISSHTLSLHTTVLWRTLHHQVIECCRYSILPDLQGDVGYRSVTVHLQVWRRSRCVALAANTASKNRPTPGRVHCPTFFILLLLPTPLLNKTKHNEASVLVNSFRTTHHSVAQLEGAKHDGPRRRTNERSRSSSVGRRPVEGGAWPLSLTAWECRTPLSQQLLCR